MYLSHKIALQPNNRQATYFKQACGTARFAYNWALAEWKRQYDAGGKPTECSLRRQLNSIKRNEFPWMLDASKCAVQNSIKNLGVAFQIFFAAFRTPPKKKSGSPFVFRAAQGTYEKHGDHVFGIIRLSWGEKIKDAPHTYPVYQSTYSSYLLVYPNGKTVQAKNRTVLDQLIAEYTG